MILNQVGSDRHEAMLRRALAPLNLPVLAVLRRDPGACSNLRVISVWFRQQSVPDLDAYLDAAADALAAITGSVRA